MLLFLKASYFKDPIFRCQQKEPVLLEITSEKEPVLFVCHGTLTPRTEFFECLFAAIQQHIRDL